MNSRRTLFALLLSLPCAGCVMNCPGTGCREATLESELLAARGGGYYLGSVAGGHPAPAELRPYHTVSPLYQSWIYGIANRFPR